MEQSDVGICASLEEKQQAKSECKSPSGLKGHLGRRAVGHGVSKPKQNEGPWGGCPCMAQTENIDSKINNGKHE